LLNHYALKVVLITSKVLQELECLSRAHGFRQELSLAHLFEQFSKLGTAAGVAHFPLCWTQAASFR
jgi:rRNA-processing protein FCF1